MKTKIFFITILIAMLLSGCANVGIQIGVQTPVEASPTPATTQPTTPPVTPPSSMGTAEVTETAPAPTSETSLTIGGASGILYASNVNGSYLDLYLQEWVSSTITRLTQGDSNFFPGGYSPDGRQITFTGFGLTSSYVGVMSADGSDPVDLTNLPEVDDGFPAWSPDGTQIAFTSRRTGNNEVFMMDPWGYNIVQLTNNPTDDFAPTWSPDGRQIAFLSDRHNKTGVYSIYIMNADGSHVQRLTNTGGNDYTPRWSPDGTTIMFRSVMNGQSDIYSVAVDGSSLTNLTDDPGEDWSPAWSPDGSWIAFQTDRDGNWEIYIMNADGSGQTNITNNPADDEMPFWKPNSGKSAAISTTKKLAFVASKGDEMALFTIDSAGENLTQLTQEKMLIMNPVWSPESNQIAFEACVGGSLSTDCPAGVSFDIFLVDQDGSNLLNLTKDPSMDRYPTWISPDEIAFSSNRSGKEEIYIIKTDGTKLIQVTNNITMNTIPKGSSDGKWLAYHCALDSETQICIQSIEENNQVIKVAGTGPVWIPLGAESAQRLAFTCWSAGHSDLCTVKPNGTDLKNLTKTNTVDEISPAWSPDGRWIVYQSNQDGVIAIYTICVDCAANPAGGRLTSGKTIANNPTWSPDGLMIAYVSNGSIYITRIENHDRKLIASDVFGAPNWQP
jgi:Tol biopolymer transport system component